MITALGVGEILGYGTTLYLPAVLAQPIALDTGWPLPWIVAGLTIGSLTAGLISHRVGHAIHTRGGRPVLIAGTVLLIVGLVGLGLSPALPLHLLAWVVIGAGMACSLYDAAFATLGTLYGTEARRAITAVTLFGGFASTVCWPLGAFFVQWLGWRGTCFAFAVLHLALTLPFYWLVLPKGSDRGEPDASRAQAAGGVVAAKMQPSREWLLFGLMATAFSLGWGISSILSVHLLAIMQARGLELASAVALGALVGPSQVGGRVFEMLLGRRYRPIYTLLISVVLVAAGLAFAYGAGIGIASIARGTLPLSIFGADHYAIWVGRLAGPALIAGAVAPVLGAVLLDGAGPAITLHVLIGLALANIGVAFVLWLVLNLRDVRPP